MRRSPFVACEASAIWMRSHSAAPSGVSGRRFAPAGSRSRASSLVGGDSVAHRSSHRTHPTPREPRVRRSSAPGSPTDDVPALTRMELEEVGCASIEPHRAAFRPRLHHVRTSVPETGSAASAGHLPRVEREVARLDGRVARSADVCAQLFGHFRSGDRLTGLRRRDVLARASERQPIGPGLVLRPVDHDRYLSRRRFRTRPFSLNRCGSMITTPPFCGS